MKTKYALFLKLIGSLFALALLAAPSLGAAQVTITQVDVVVGGQHFCDTTTACGNQIWDLGGGKTLTPGQTLILTQTGTMLDAGGNVEGGNFDTSDRGPQLSACSTAGGTACTTQIFINSGSGLTKVYDDTAAPGNPLSQFNDEPITSPPLFAFNESLTWVSAFTGSTFTLQLGYADNEHGNPCPAAGCFPQPVWGTAAANVFIGAGLAPPFGDCGVTRDDTDNVGNHVGCYDAGALLITALAPPPPRVCPLTQGFWKNHSAAWPVATLTIGGVAYTEAQLLTVLNKSVGGDAVLILADQLIASLLNVASGATTTPAVAAAIADAQTLLTGINLLSHTLVKTSSALGQKMVNDATILDNFNNAAFSPGCTG